MYVAQKEKLLFYPSIKTEPVYSLGAGDAFTSAFIGSMGLDIPVEDALIYGIVNASSVIQYPDAQQGLLPLSELAKRAEICDKKLLKRYPL